MNEWMVQIEWQVNDSMGEHSLWVLLPFFFNSNIINNIICYKVHPIAFNSGNNKVMGRVELPFRQFKCILSKYRVKGRRSNRKTSKMNYYDF